MPLTAEYIVERARSQERIEPIKYVRTDQGYVFGSVEHDSHCNLVPKGAKAESAGMVMIFRGEMAYLMTDGSITLDIGPDDRDEAGLAAALGIPVTVMDLNKRKPRPEYASAGFPAAA